MELTEGSKVAVEWATESLRDAKTVNGGQSYLMNRRYETTFRTGGDMKRSLYPLVAMLTTIAVCSTGARADGLENA